MSDLPVLISTPEPWVVFSFLCQAEDGSDRVALVGIWYPARVHPSELIRTFLEENFIGSERQTRPQKVLVMYGAKAKVLQLLIWSSSSSAAERLEISGTFILIGSLWAIQCFPVGPKLDSGNPFWSSVVWASWSEAQHPLNPAMQQFPKVPEKDRAGITTTSHRNRLVLQQEGPWDVSPGLLVPYFNHSANIFFFQLLHYLKTFVFAWLTSMV